MPRILPLTRFQYSDDGITPRWYEPGPDPVEVSAACAKVAIEESWAVPFGLPAEDGKPGAEKQTRAKSGRRSPASGKAAASASSPADPASAQPTLLSPSPGETGAEGTGATPAAASSPSTGPSTSAPAPTPSTAPTDPSGTPSAVPPASAA